MNTYESSAVHPTILLVEDEPILRELLTCALEDLGATVFPVGTAEEGRRLSLRQAFSLLLTDVRTPGPLNGLALAQELHDRQPATRIIVMSGYHDAASTTLPPGAVFLPKPWALDQLLAVIGDQLGKVKPPSVRPAA
ncbi:response regulator [Pseudomonas oryzicola]|uniref:Response regulator n=1 Tax=Pseudomonas oryzicola TaxID=485876 RepID=A0ABS6QAL1_9PSED|nr:response regulator [Pseudomonas oryzicola]MBV4491233.1 response regulator [Pseudomonas oryzicola]